MATSANPVRCCIGSTLVYLASLALLLPISANQCFKLIQLFFLHMTVIEQIHQHCRIGTLEIPLEKAFRRDFPDFIASDACNVNKSSATRRMLCKALAFHDSEETLNSLVVGVWCRWQSIGDVLHGTFSQIPQCFQDKKFRVGGQDNASFGISVAAPHVRI